MKQHRVQANLLGDVEVALQQLNPKEAMILRLRFGIGDRTHDPTEVEARCGVPRTLVQQIEARAFRKLRAAAVEEYFRAQTAQTKDGASADGRQ